jgi:hypothetical protein
MPRKKSRRWKGAGGVKGFVPPRLAARGSLDNYFWMLA